MKPSPEIAVIAQCLYEIRLLLAGHLGSTCESETPIRLAAHLAYALHNQALAAIAGERFDVQVAIQRVRAGVAVVDPKSCDYFVQQIATAVAGAQAQQIGQGGLPGSSSQ